MSNLMARAETMAAAARENLDNQIDRISMDAADPYYNQSRDDWAELLDALRSTVIEPMVLEDLYGVYATYSDRTSLYTQTALDAAGSTVTDAGDPVVFTASIILFQ